MRVSLTIALVLLGSAGCSEPDTTPGDARPGTGSIEVRHVADVEWEMLNPARGDASPRAGTLWGDRKGTVPTGFLAQFVDGFSSPPHAHNVTYRAVVIFGNVHNDDPAAETMWMPPGSFWTQPQGAVHITSASGTTNVALVEIDHGPYLVIPPEEAFETDERPVNVDISNLVWVDPSGGAPSAGEPQVAYLWGRLDDGESNGTFLKLPAGFVGAVRSRGSVLRAVVIAGTPRHAEGGVDALEPGSYFGSQGAADHRIESAADEATVLYVRTNGPYEVVRATNTGGGGQGAGEE